MFIHLVFPHDPWKDVQGDARELTALSGAELLPRPARQVSNADQDASRSPSGTIIPVRLGRHGCKSVHHGELFHMIEGVLPLCRMDKGLSLVDRYFPLMVLHGVVP